MKNKLKDGFFNRVVYTLRGEFLLEQVLNTLDGVESAAVNSARGWNGFVAGKKANAASGKSSVTFLDQRFSRK